MHSDLPLRRLLVLAVAAASLSACTRTSLTDCVADGDAPVVINRGPGAWERTGKQAVLRAAWRTDETATDLAIGFPAALSVSRSGRLALADWERNEVVVFSAEGKPLGTWPRDVSLGTPVAVTWDAEDGLHIFDLTASAYLRTDSLGKLAARQATSERMLDAAAQAGGLKWAGVLPDGTVFFQPLHAFDRGSKDVADSYSILWRQRAAATTIDTIARAPVRLLGYTMRANQAAPTWPYLGAATGAGDLVAVGGRNGAYRIDLQNAAGKRILTVCRDAEPLPLTEEERGNVEPKLDAELLRSVPRPDRLAPYARFFLGAEGQLWVQRDRSSAVNADSYTPVHGNPGGLFDVFDSAGAYLGDIRAPASVRLLAAAGQFVYGVEHAEQGELHIVAYRVEFTDRK